MNRISIWFINYVLGIFLMVMMFCCLCVDAFRPSINKTYTQATDRDLQNLFSDIIANTLPKEKVYLHLDNSSYYKDDTMWFLTYGIMHDMVRSGGVGFEPFLSDAAVSGYLKSGSKRNTVPLDGQYIKVFDDIAEKGALNVANTRVNGYFEVSPEMASSLGRTLLLKPLVGEDMKPRLEFDCPFNDISEIRKKSKERHYPVFRKISGTDLTDTMDLSD